MKLTRGFLDYQPCSALQGDSCNSELIVFKPLENITFHEIYSIAKLLFL